MGPRGEHINKILTGLKPICHQNKTDFTPGTNQLDTLFAPGSVPDKGVTFLHVLNISADQPAHMHSLISTFVICTIMQVELAL